MKFYCYYSLVKMFVKRILNFYIKQSTKRFLGTTPVPAIISEWEKNFEQAKLDDAKFSLKCILSHVLNVNFSSLSNYDNLNLTAKQLEDFERMCNCRMSRMPIQYIIGNWEFCNLTLNMMPPVFIPRPETEKLVELVVMNHKLDSELNFLEIGCGTGAISLAILHSLPNSTGTALDHSKLACNLAQFNVTQLGYEKRFKVIGHKVSQHSLVPQDINGIKFDAIISNPPYIKTKDLQNLPLEVKLYEDLQALNGGTDGLQVVNLICELTKQHLKSSGKLWLEVDSSHIAPITKLLLDEYKSFLSLISVHKDVFGIERFIEIKKK